MAYGLVSADTLVTSTSGGILGAGNASIMKNRIINGAMVIDQRNAGGTVSNSTNYVFPVDRFRFGYSASGVITGQRSTTVPTGAGFTNSLYLTVTTPSTLSTAGDYFAMGQGIEGVNTADLMWGTANAKTVTVSFWVRSSITGQYSVTLYNSAGNRNYPATYTISAANTWEQKSITIAGDTTGTWATDTSTGINIFWNLGGGSSYNGTNNAWQTTAYTMGSGQTPWISTSGATFYITGVQLEVGSSATGFEYVNYQTSLANCQRYYEKSYDAGVVPNTNAGYSGNILFVGSSNGSSLFGYVTMQVPKRSSPTVTIYPPSGGTANTFDNGGTVGGSYIGYSGFGIYTSTLTGSRTTAQWIASAEL